MRTFIPFSASRQAVIAPPKPLPMTMTSSCLFIPEVPLLAHSLFVSANRSGRVVLVITPAGVVKLDDVIGVIRTHHLGKSQKADALPVGDGDAAESGETAPSAGVRNRDFEFDSASGLCRPRLEDV